MWRGKRRALAHDVGRSEGQLFTFPAGAASNRTVEPCHCLPTAQLPLIQAWRWQCRHPLIQSFPSREAGVIAWHATHTWLAPLSGTETICLKGADTRNRKTSLGPAAGLTQCENLLLINNQDWYWLRLHVWLMIPGAICDVNMADHLSSAGSVLFSTLELPPPGRQACPLKTESMGCPAGDISIRVVHFHTHCTDQIWWMFELKLRHFVTS